MKFKLKIRAPKRISHLDRMTDLTSISPLNMGGLANSNFCGCCTCCEENLICDCLFCQFGMATSWILTVSSFTGCDELNGSFLLTYVGDCVFEAVTDAEYNDESVKYFLERTGTNTWEVTIGTDSDSLYSYTVNMEDTYDCCSSTDLDLDTDFGTEFCSIPASYLTIEPATPCPDTICCVSNFGVSMPKNLYSRVTFNSATQTFYPNIFGIYGGSFTGWDWFYLDNDPGTDVVLCGTSGRIGIRETQLLCSGANGEWFVSLVVFLFDQGAFGLQVELNTTFGTITNVCTISTNPFHLTCEADLSTLGLTTDCGDSSIITLEFFANADAATGLTGPCL